MTDLTFYHRKERPWFNRLERAAIVGHTSTDRSRIWIRMKKAGHYQLVLATFPIRDLLTTLPVQVESGWTIAIAGKPKPLLQVHDVSVDGSTDFTAVIEIKGLEANTCYHYAVACVDDQSWELGNENTHSFTTMPAASDQGWDIAFGLYSCHMPFDPKEPSKADASMWSLFYDELCHANARFTIGGGDQVYSDGVEHLNIWSWLKKVKKHNPKLDDMVSWYRDIYRGYWGFQDLKQVYRSFPSYMTWDDHEIMDGWGSYTKKELSNQLDTLFEWEDVGKNTKLAQTMFKAATKVYEEYEHSHNPKTKAGVYDFALNTCGADFFVLDMRGQRNFDRKKDAILGSTQWQRLTDWSTSLKKAPTPIFVVSSVPIVHLKDYVANLFDWVSIFGNRDDVRDHWAHDKHGDEVTKLLNTLFETSHRTERPLVVLSGDVHIGCLFKLHEQLGLYPNAKVCQVTSSPITYAAMGTMKKKLLHTTVAKSGDIGNGTPNSKVSGFSFTNHAIFPQRNIAIIRYRSQGDQLLNLSVELTGQADDRPGVKETSRFDLLRLFAG